jgi:hypothetical protein
VECELSWSCVSEVARSRFYHKCKEYSEPTSGLEPLTSSPATSELFHARLQGSVLFLSSRQHYLVGATLGQQGAESYLAPFCSFGVASLSLYRLLWKGSSISVSLPSLSGMFPAKQVKLQKRSLTAGEQSLQRRAPLE